MANLLTTARLELLNKLKANAVLLENVAEWHEWKEGLKQRLDYKPASCPLLSLVPADLSEEELSNITDRFPQDLALEILTYGQDASVSEGLVVAVIEVLAVARADHMDMADDGLASIDLVRISWRAYERPADSSFRWLVRMTIRINWFLRSWS